METEGFIAIQHQVIATKNYLKYMVNDPNIGEDKGRRCHLLPGSIKHVTAGCKMLAHTENLHRYNSVSIILRHNIAQMLKLAKDLTLCYQYKPSKFHNGYSKVHHHKYLPIRQEFLNTK